MLFLSTGPIPRKTKQARRIQSDPYVWRGVVQLWHKWGSIARLAAQRAKARTTNLRHPALNHVSDARPELPHDWAEIARG
jgi:hypothetical protein